jgi:hypothetical protein
VYRISLVASHSDLMYTPQKLAVTAALNGFGLTLITEVCFEFYNAFSKISSSSSSSSSSSIFIDYCFVVVFCDSHY